MLRLLITITFALYAGTIGADAEVKNCKLVQFGEGPLATPGLMLWSKGLASNSCRNFGIQRNLCIEPLSCQDGPKNAAKKTVAICLANPDNKTCPGANRCYAEFISLRKEGKIVDRELAGSLECKAVADAPGKFLFMSYVGHFDFSHYVGPQCNQKRPLPVCLGSLNCQPPKTTVIVNCDDKGRCSEKAVAAEPTFSVCHESECDNITSCSGDLKIDYEYLSPKKLWDPQKLPLTGSRSGTTE